MQTVGFVAYGEDSTAKPVVHCLLADKVANFYLAAIVFERRHTDVYKRQVWKKDHYLLDPHGACGFRALAEGLKPGETGVFLETAHPAKFKDTVEKIIGEAVELPAKLQAFMRGEKKSLPMSKDFADFKQYLMHV